MPYKPRYEGTRWKLAYGEYAGVERHAVNEVQKGIQKYVPYVIEVVPAAGTAADEDAHLILIGTPQNNPHLRRLIDAGMMDEPSHPQGYSLVSCDSPWHPGSKIIAVAGFDAAGVLYGVEELLSQMLSPNMRIDNPAKTRDALDAIDAFRIADYPRVENRGIWTWGYVIYDYRRFLDNMARLRLNMITVWNDQPPLNVDEFIDYAHSLGIQVVMGFQWGWGMEGIDPTNPDSLRQAVADIRRDYLEHYHPLNIDGIYFQTFTETYETAIGGRSIASLACEWVNRISEALYEIKPDLSIQFGLHATSVTDTYLEFRDLDPRITIAWEDGGALPYPYEPVTDLRPLGYTKPEAVLTSEGALEFSRNLVSFRENREFAMVPKGYTALRWDTEFEHHGPFILGERDADWIARRASERQTRWDRINALWLRNFPVAARFYREILACQPSKMTLTALIEDGLFESGIQPAVALFAETAWNPGQTDLDLLRRASSPRYR